MVTTELARIDSYLLPVQELAENLGVSPRQIWRLDSVGKLPRPVIVGQSKRWRRAEILSWIDAGCPDRAAWDGLRRER